MATLVILAYILVKLAAPWWTWVAWSLAFTGWVMRTIRMAEEERK